MESDATTRWEPLSPEELVAKLQAAGLDLPSGLVEEIARRGPEAVPALGRLATDARAWESELPWGPLFALHLLGGIGDAAAAPFVLGALRLDPDPDEIVGNTPTIIGHLGAAAIPEVARFILDEGAPGLMRAVACDGLASIALLHPFTRVPVIGFLRRFVEDAKQHDVEAVTGAVLALLELRDEESLPAIVRAFHDHRVDEDLIRIEDAREAYDIPESISTDWHYTGDPLEFLSEESRQQLRKRHRHG